MRKLSVRITAVLLMLVLIQGAGLRLIVHNALHKTITTATTNDHPKGSMQAFCDCLDEALMPCNETPATELVLPQQQSVLLQPAYQVYLTSVIKIFHSLRAPPSYTA